MVTNRWDAIPEEESNESRNDSFNLTSSAEATQRLETIRNGMILMACKPMEQLTLDVEAVRLALLCSWCYWCWYWEHLMLSLVFFFFFLSLSIDLEYKLCLFIFRSV